MVEKKIRTNNIFFKKCIKFSSEKSKILTQNIILFQEAINGLNIEQQHLKAKQLYLKFNTLNKNIWGH